MASKSTDPIDNWMVQVRKGLVELFILNDPAQGERYGYELVKSLVESPALGLSEGTIYPLLSRLRVQGLVETRLVESSDGPARKYYKLTPAGRRAIKAMNRYFDSLNEEFSEIRENGSKT